jgi:hypothetical protein
MILLLTVPYLGQAGVKRLQISRRRTRREKQLKEILSVLNRRDINRGLDIAAPYSLKSTHFDNPGLTPKPMFTRINVTSLQIAAGRSCKGAFPAVPSNPASFIVPLNSGSGTSGPETSATVLKTLWKNSVAEVLAPIVLSFSRTA